MLRWCPQGRELNTKSPMLSWFRRGRNSPAPPTTSSTTHQNGSDDEFYGVTDKLIEHVKSFTVDTFKNFELPEDVSDEAPTSSGGVRMDLSEWQQQHAAITLSRAKEVSQLRYMLCPRHLKERQFWSIYFILVKSFSQSMSFEPYSWRNSRPWPGRNLRPEKSLNLKCQRPRIRGAYFLLQQHDEGETVIIYGEFLMGVKLAAKRNPSSVHAQEFIPNDGSPRRMNANQLGLFGCHVKS